LLLAFLSFSFSRSDFPPTAEPSLFPAPKPPFNSPELFAPAAGVLELRRQPTDLAVGVIVLLLQPPLARLDFLIQCRIFRTQVVVLRLEVQDLRLLPVQVIV
jgi:hypothetical protein